MQETAYMKDAKSYRAQFAFMCVWCAACFLIASVGVILFSYLASAENAVALTAAVLLNSISMYFAVELKDAVKGFVAWTDVVAGQRAIAHIRSHQ